jgi:RND family efflux transporter MFP subunit
MSMNFESRPLTPETGGPDGSSWEEEDARRSKRRRWILIGAIALALIVAYGAWRALSGTGGDAADQGNANIPSVTVMVPGRTQVEGVIVATGSLAARREMPVGVAGEGGQVARVLVEPGQWVAAGQTLATIDRQVQTQQIAQLEAQVRVAQANAHLAQAQLDRAQALVDRGFVSRADIDQRTATRDAANAQVRVAQASVAETRARTGRLDIRAPAAGLVLTRGVEPGQVVSSGSGVLFRIARGGEMELLAQVSETDFANLAVGARATVTPVGSETGFPGQIWQLSPVIDPQSRQGTARIAVAYAPGIRPGGFAEARIISGSQQAPLLPESAVLNDDRGSYVYIVGADNKAERRDVRIGQVSDAGVPVISGLTGQEKIVVSAGAFLNPGDRVNPVQPRRQAR